jgi:uncharacterized protein involved in high-affinity Fe2+ transport
MAAEFHVGDVGTALIATILDNGTAMPLATATTLQYILRKPSGTEVTKTALLYTDGSDGKIKYITVAGDFDEAGHYKIQAYIVNPSGNWYTEIYTFRVYPNL